MGRRREEGDGDNTRMFICLTCIGNHSAGKSSFINWCALNIVFSRCVSDSIYLRYIEEQVQATSMAIESKGFTFITSGVKEHQAPIKGEATLMMFPQVASLKPGFITHYSSRILNKTIFLSVKRAEGEVRQRSHGRPELF